MAGAHTTTHKEKDLSKAAFRLHLHVTSKVLKPRRDSKQHAWASRTPQESSPPSSLPSCNLLRRTGNWE